MRGATVAQIERAVNNFTAWMLDQTYEGETFDNVVNELKDVEEHLKTVCRELEAVLKHDLPMKVEESLCDVCDRLDDARLDIYMEGCNLRKGDY